MRENKIGNMCNAIFGIFICLNIIPFFKSFSLYYYINIGLILLWLALSSIRCKKYYSNIKKIILFILLFGLYTFILPILFGNSVISNRYLNVFSLFFYYIVYDYNSSTNNQNNKLLSWIFINTVITYTTTILALLKNNYVARSIKSSGELTISLLKQNIGGYEFIYFIHILLILYLICFLEEEKLYKKIIYIITVIMSLYLVIISNYLTALIIDLIIVISILFSKFLSKKSKIIRMFACTILFVCCIFYKNILNTMIDTTTIFTGNSYNTVRLLQLKDELNGKGENIYSDRSDRIILNINQTLSYPLTGIVIDKIEYEGNYLSGFGQHSFITDTYALFGLFIGSLLIYILIVPLYSFIKKYKDYKMFIILISADLFIILFINNFDTLLGLVVYYMMPTYFDFIENKKNVLTNTKGGK